MPARTPRRSFASPFVVTLAAAPACWVTTNPPPPPPQGSPQVVQQPTQQPTQQPAQQPAQTDPQQPPPVIVANPPRPQPTDTRPIPIANPPRPTPVQTHWTIYKGVNGCTAAVKVDCGPSDPNMPRHTCNPPPARAYACPPELEAQLASGPVTIVGDGTTCTTEPEMPSCPPNVMCNPPRPRKVDCPK